MLTSPPSSAGTHEQRRPTRPSSGRSISTTRATTGRPSYARSMPAEQRRPSVPAALDRPLDALDHGPPSMLDQLRAAQGHGPGDGRARSPGKRSTATAAVMPLDALDRAEQRHRRALDLDHPAKLEAPAIVERAALGEPPAKLEAPAIVERAALGEPPAKLRARTR
jgi:hypothetical protein